MRKLATLTTAALVLAVISPATVNAQVPSLQGEGFFQGFPNITAACDESGGVSTISVRTSGSASGPYPGTYTETVTVTIAAQEGDAPAALLSVEASFSIDSPAGQVTGTKTFVDGSAEGRCDSGETVVGNNGNTSRTGVLYSFFAEVVYEATITTDQGAYIDRGLATVSSSYSNTATLNDQGACCNETTSSAFSERFTLSSGVVSAGPGAPASLVLTPPAATNTVGTQHSITATVVDDDGAATPDIKVRFSVSGSVATTGACTTDADGQCSFTYTGPQLTGADLIVACSDTDDDGAVGPGEPCGEATKAWLLPTSTPGQVTGGGHVLNPEDGEEVAFGFNAKAGASGLQGNCTFIDKAPTRNVKIKCITVDALVQSGNTATFFGSADINGTSTSYRIDVTDNGEPGAGQDTMTIHTGTGYSAGGILDNGNVQVHQP